MRSLQERHSHHIKRLANQTHKHPYHTRYIPLSCVLCTYTKNKLDTECTWKRLQWYSQKADQWSALCQYLRNISLSRHFIVKNDAPKDWSNSTGHRPLDCRNNNSLCTHCRCSCQRSLQTSIAPEHFPSVFSRRSVTVELPVGTCSRWNLSWSSTEGRNSPQDKPTLSSDPSNVCLSSTVFSFCWMHRNTALTFLQLKRYCCYCYRCCCYCSWYSFVCMRH